MKSIYLVELLTESFANNGWLYFWIVFFFAACYFFFSMALASMGPGRKAVWRYSIISLSIGYLFIVAGEGFPEIKYWLLGLSLLSLASLIFMGCALASHVSFKEIWSDGAKYFWPTIIFAISIAEDFHGKVDSMRYFTFAWQLAVAYASFASCALLVAWLRHLAWSKQYRV